MNASSLLGGIDTLVNNAGLARKIDFMGDIFGVDL